MEQGNQQTWHDSPKFTIDCVLANVNSHIEADGCVLERIEGGCKLTTPAHLRVGDLVKVQLWLEGEEAFIDIRLAEVRKIQGHWIAAEVRQVSPNDRMRLRRFIDVPAAVQIKEPALIEPLLIRA